ncbi:MAG: hypothetical protein LLG00_12805 [Planctomycetaceae bacterium]|nr:hypothetical protein [Planctomycetaceae bacterium]
MKASCLLLAVVLLSPSLCVAANVAPVSVTVDTATIVNTMRGGIGASWHAIETPILYSETPHPVFGNKSHGGSGWGAYPPAEDDVAWRQIDRHARWLGFDWNRVEIEQRVYEPERGRFSFDNPEMRILYRILDWCEKNHADVFLQQMWANVRWNTVPQWRDDEAGRIHSAPQSTEDFAEGIATLVNHLVKRKGYTCIRWLCISNEPNGWWKIYPNRSVPMRPALAAVRKALDARGLGIPLSGPDVVAGVPPLRPDMTDAVPVLQPERFDFIDLLGAYDFHTYDETLDWLGKQNNMAWFDKTTADWAAWAHKQGKPLFMSEVGTMANGWGANSPAPGSYASAFQDTTLIVRRIAAGADGFNRWSFLNRGDLDGQWQFIDTWDPKAKKLLGHYTPHPNTYYLIGLLSRFTAKHSDVFRCTVDGGRIGKWPRVFAAALRSPKGNVTLLVINHAEEPFDASFRFRGLTNACRLHRYSMNQSLRDRADLKINPEADFRLTAAAPTLKDRLAPMSLTVYSTYAFRDSDDGVTAD